MRMRISQRSCLVAGAAVLVAATAGCRVDLGAPVNDPQAGAVRFTDPAAASMLVIVSGAPGARPLAAQVIPATTRPREDLDVLEAGSWGRAVAAAAPPPVTVTVAGRPAPLASGASSYQQAEHNAALRRWRDRLTEGKRAASVRTMANVAAWAHRLPLSEVLDGPAPSTAATSLPAEVSLAASAASGLVTQAGVAFGTRRVLLLDVTSLGGALPAGELDGDDVIVRTPDVPTQAAASAAQENLLAAGASAAAVLGPEATVSELDQLVTDGLSQDVVTQSLSGPALFADNSSSLLPTAVAALTPLIGPLSRTGACGVINGYASAPGSVRHNQALSQARAVAVARFLQARGVPGTCLLVAGHGATRLFGSGNSGDNRRVVVVIEEPRA